MAMFWFFIPFIIIINFVLKTQSINILMLEEVPSPSHHEWIRKVTTQLALKGYNVTTLSPQKEKVSVPNLHFIHLEELYPTMHSNSESFYDLINIGQTSYWNQHNFLCFSFGLAGCAGAIKSKGWKQLENYPDDFKFDLVIHDSLIGLCYLAFLPKFNYPPLITLSGSNDIPILGTFVNNIITPSVNTHYLMQEVPETLSDRVYNFLLQWLDRMLRIYYFYPKMDRLLSESAGLIGLPKIKDLTARTSLVLFNHDPFTSSPEHLPPNMIEVGGLQIVPANPISEELEVKLKLNTKKGLILFSLGTNIPVDAVGEKRLKEIMAAFKKFPDYAILCKFDADSLPFEIPENVVVLKWVLQNDILAHNKTKLFITHSGLLSTQEAVWHGVPIIGMPTFYDQFLNIDKAVNKGLGERIRWSELSTNVLYEKMKKILDNDSYAKNMKFISNLYRDQKESPLERALWWIEWMIRNPNGGRFLQGINNDMSYMELLSIDVILVLFLAVFILTSVIICLVVWYLRCKFFKNNKGRKVKLN